MRQKRLTQTPPRSERNWRVVQEWMPDEASAEMLDGMEFGFKKGVLAVVYRPKAINCILEFKIAGGCCMWKNWCS
ncbi:hypothetical protein CEXT_490001 [Caerostris extrusa]|uniref:Uncharacterized protein n=1 Tax=Caerostris extrusa TaxID=172846 RepID=A0AAV4XYK4_CAEEX|nr:hypothetical protein CEXT_490001 [Caerostris extrusa]